MNDPTQDNSINNHTRHVSAFIEQEETHHHLWVTEKLINDILLRGLLTNNYTTQLVDGLRQKTKIAVVYVASTNQDLERELYSKKTDSQEASLNPYQLQSRQRRSVKTWSVSRPSLSLPVQCWWVDPDTWGGEDVCTVDFCGWAPHQRWLHLTLVAAVLFCTATHDAVMIQALSLGQVQPVIDGW